MRTTLKELYKKGIRKVIVKDIIAGLTMEMILRNPVYAWSLHTEDEEWWGLANEATVIEIDGKYIVITDILSNEEVIKYFC